MKLKYQILILALLVTQPAFAQLKPQKVSVFKEKHPIVYRVGTPVRWTWNSMVWIGQKTQPIHPFLNLCGAAGNIAGPFVYGFTR